MTVRSRARSASGTPLTISAGNSRAVIAPLGAGLRLFQVDGTAATETYGDGSISPGAAGITLAPWANRIRDGVWQLAGQKQQLDVTEVSLHNASHGLLRNTGYQPVFQSDSAVVLEASIYPQHGYPFLLRHRVSYTVSAAHLQVKQTLENDGTDAAPFVLGAHPYLRIGNVPTENLELTVRAATRLLNDEQSIPVGREPVAGAADLRRPAAVGKLDVDTAYTDLEFDGGRVASTLRAPDGRSVELWQDESCPYVHVFVSRVFPGRTVALALEPMSGPTDAFNSGESLGWVQPGTSASIRWGIRTNLG